MLSLLRVVSFDCDLFYHIALIQSAAFHLSVSYFEVRVRVFISSVGVVVSFGQMEVKPFFSAGRGGSTDGRTGRWTFCVLGSAFLLQLL